MTVENGIIAGLDNARRRRERLTAAVGQLSYRGRRHLFSELVRSLISSPFGGRPEDIASNLVNEINSLVLPPVAQGTFAGLAADQDQADFADIYRHGVAPRGSRGPRQTTVRK